MSQGAKLLSAYVILTFPHFKYQESKLSFFIILFYLSIKCFVSLMLSFSGLREIKALNYSQFFCLIFLFFFQDRVFLCSPGYPDTHFVVLVGLKLRDVPATP